VKKQALTAQEAKACCECIHFTADDEHSGTCSHPSNLRGGNLRIGRLSSCRHWEPLNPPEPVRWGAYVLYPDGWYRLATKQ
jgi:hypothetical protein